MKIRPTPAICWDTAHMEGDNVLVHLSMRDPVLHILVIPREPLEDALRDQGSDPLRLAMENQGLVTRAAEIAWQRDNLREIFELGGVQRNTQLWLEAGDFEAVANL